MRGYKLYSNNTAGANAAASVKIARKGTVKAIKFTLALTGGAGVGRMCVEVSKQNVQNINVNDAPESVFAVGACAVGNAVCATAADLVVCSIPVDVGDTIYLNSSLAGTAPSSCDIIAYLYVD